ncbi:transmembrane emp24 domain-containing protein 4 [Mesoplodon densirostris]|uniref:transmembrane emp24 domain-containing protein 4 n=1 Tax=Mesoplodon densirostris TaxID=48708 RepID=UPI0028DC0CF4|nr:transmembrane emp24 domain-containing protein 4 [Mesoplodon densirostris]
MRDGSEKGTERNLDQPCALEAQQVVARGSENQETPAPTQRFPKVTKPTAQPESGREAPSVLRVRTLPSAVHPGLEDARGAGQSGRREGGTAHAYSAPGLAASFESWAQVRACALGGGRALAGVWAGRRRAMGLLALLLIALCAPGTRGLYFHIGETEKRCFIEEIPDETMVIGNYRTQMWDKQKEIFLPSTPGLGMHVEVKDPEGKVVLSRQYGSEGRFTFTSHTPGDHQICLHSNSTRMALFAGGRLRVHLDIQVGEHANNYPEIAAKDKLTELQLRARQLLDQVEQIQKEQDYQRYREERFRLISESTNQRVLWWSIAQTVILILTGIWQMRHLKSFFEAKKLV